MPCKLALADGISFQVGFQDSVEVQHCTKRLPQARIVDARHVRSQD